MDNFLIILGIVLLVIVVVILAYAIGAFVLMFAWNLFVPSVFGLQAISFWQALGGSMLISIIGGAFKTFNTKK